MRDKRGQEKRLCPNPNCKNHDIPSLNFCKDGFYQRTIGKKEKIQRYRCKACGKRFHGTFDRLTYRQKKPEINSKFMRIYMSGVSLRRTTFLLGVNRKTLAKRILTHGAMARKKHEENLQNTNYFWGMSYSFDEMETKLGSKLFPVSIAIAVNEDSGRIIDIRAARMPLKGRLVERMKKDGEKIPYSPDNRPEARANVLGAVALANSNQFDIYTDRYPGYNLMIEEVLKNAIHHQVSGVANRGDSESDTDPMFWLNHICARIRADLGRMGRRSWCFSRSLDALQGQLDMFMEFFNRRIYKVSS